MDTRANYTRGKKEIRSVIQVVNESSAKTLYQQAMAAFRQKQMESAVTLLEKALQSDPSYADALEALGVLYANTGKLDQAIERMKQLAQADTDNIMAHTNLSRFYQQKGFIDEAEAEQAEARRLSWKAELKAKRDPSGSHSESPEAEQPVSLEEEIEKIGRRIQTAQRAIAFDPKDVLGYFSLGSVYLDAKRYIEAVDALKQAVAADPKHSPSYASLGQGLEACGQKEEAQRTYEKGIQVAKERGDIVPLRRMEYRLKKLPQGSA